MLPHKKSTNDVGIPSETLSEFASALDELQHHKNSCKSNDGKNLTTTHSNKNISNYSMAEENQLLKIKITELEKEKHKFFDFLIKLKDNFEDVDFNQHKEIYEFEKLKILIQNITFKDARDDAVHNLIDDLNLSMENEKFKIGAIKNMIENFISYNFEEQFHGEINHEVYRLKMNNENNLNNVPLPNATSTPVNMNGNVNGTVSITPTSPPIIINDKLSPIQYNQVKATSLNDVNLDEKRSVLKKGTTRYEKDNDYQNIKNGIEQAAVNNQKLDKDVIKKKSNRSLRQFFGRIIRSNSQEIELRNEEFKRGSAIRSTAGPRLGWTNEISNPDSELPFSQWDVERIAVWFHSMGLSMYLGDCKRWVKNGEHLLNASTHDIEKELGIRNHFHRKKLQLALQIMVTEPKSAISLLDHNWITKWLDDIGLPQYKDNFFEARIDGRMLNYLTIEDLVNLKVTNLLHHMSIQRGIQILRSHDFNPSFLKRRSDQSEGTLQNCPNDVVIWTNHRIMEWLRSIDLSEYAPNLRGSGVHGSLMILEPRLSAELFATLLSIPTSKTLLRRHLTTHFVALIGPNIQQQKREVENDPAFTPIIPGQKIKVSKKSSIFKSTKMPDTYDEYICPFLENTHNLDFQVPIDGPLVNEKQSKYVKREMRLPSSDV